MPEKKLSSSKASRVDRMAVLRLEEKVDAVPKGRRMKTDKELPLHQRLYAWLAARRATVYCKTSPEDEPRKKHATPSPHMLHCRLCNIEFDAKRDSCIHFVLQHETTDKHWNQTHGHVPRPCKGLKMEAEPDECLYKIQTATTTFHAWVREDMPWHLSKECSHGCHVDPESKEVWLQSQACHLRPNDLRDNELICHGCQALANNVKFLSGVARWGFCFDVVALLHATYTGNRKLRASLLASIETADYASVVLPELKLSAKQLHGMDFSLLRKIVQRLFGFTHRAYRNEAANSYLASRFDWLPSSLSQKDLAPELQRQLSDHVGFLGGLSNEAGVNNSMLHGALARKRLDTMATCRTLMSCLAHRCELLGRNRKRVNTSSVPGVEQSSLADIGFFLSSLTSTSALMELFGLSQKLSKAPIDAPGLPRFFDPCPLEPPEHGRRSELWESVHAGIQLLDTHGTRNCMLAFDETVVFPTYAMLRDERGSFYVGGGDDKARLDVGSVRPSELKKTELAQTVVCYVVPLCAYRHFPCFFCVPTLVALKLN